LIDRILFAAVVVCYCVLVFATFQAHIAAAQLNLDIEASYQSQLRDLCPREPTFHLCKDIGRDKDAFHAYERWVVKFAI